MPTFQYEALNQAGQPQKGTVDAASNEDAIQRIKGQGLFPTSVRERKVKKKAGGPTGAAPKKKGGQITIGFGGVSQKLVTQFSRQMSTLQDAGLPILRSLQILSEQQKPGPLKGMLEQIAVDVEGGSSLSEAMAKHPKAFDRLYTKMIAAGEIGGVLDIILQRLADFMEKAQQLKKRVVSAMIYPIAVVSIAVLIVMGIMIVVVPKFKTIFSDFGTKLPGPTLMLMGFADWVAGQQEGQVIPGWIIVIGAPFALFFGSKIVSKSKAGRMILDRLKLKIPVLGKLTKAGSIARFTRTLGTLIAAGVPILEAIAITRDTVGNGVYENALQKVHDSIREGESFAGPLRETKVVDLLVVNMIDVGEETGELDKMLTKVADNYDEEVDNLVRALMSLLEPLLILFLGVAVGGIVIALFMPIPALIGGVMGQGGG
ncbi:MAG: type II secretion system F family protein [Phycisphaeraceae bacterium]